MDKSKRKVVIAGNWKMNLTPSAAAAYAGELKTALAEMSGCDIVVCVPAVDISAVTEALKGTNIHVGAQNVHWAENGAFTGEISAEMLAECGVKYVIIGHSERRQYFGETDINVNARLKAALAAGLTAIVCVGETLEQREQGITEEVVALQTKIAFMDISDKQLDNIIIAYEPVWAIGTGKTATSDEADRVNGIIRDVVAGIYCPDAAQAVTIQYGGSMNAANAAELLGKPNVDGGLIGGASLKAADFAVIVKAAQ